MKKSYLFIAIGLLLLGVSNLRAEQYCNTEIQLIAGDPGETNDQSIIFSAYKSAENQTTLVATSTTSTITGLYEAVLQNNGGGVTSTTINASDSWTLADNTMTCVIDWTTYPTSNLQLYLVLTRSQANGGANIFGKQILNIDPSATCGGSAPQEPANSDNLFDASTTTFKETYFAHGNWEGDDQNLSYGSWNAAIGTANVTIGVAKDTQWQGQLKLTTNAINFDASKQYKFSCKMHSVNAMQKVTIKVGDSEGNNVLYMNESVTLSAGDNTIKSESFAGGAYDNILVFDFGHATAGDQITISDISITEVENTNNTPVAPTAPATQLAYPAEQVVSIYADNYTNAPNNTVLALYGWCGEMAASDETISGNACKKAVLNSGCLGFGYAPDNNGVNVAQMEKVHMDIWSDQTVTANFFIISPGKETYQSISLQAGQWNAINVDLSVYSSVVDLTNMWQAKIADIQGATLPITLYIDNFCYYRTTPIPEDNDAPTNFTASVQAGIKYAILSCSAEDANATVTYTVTGDVTLTKETAPNKTEQIVLSNLTPATSYTIHVNVKDGNNNNGGTQDITFATKALPTTTPAPAPTHPADLVKSVYSDAYTSFTPYVRAMDWGNLHTISSTAAVEGNNVYVWENFDYKAFEYVDAKDFSDMTHFHIDVYPIGTTTFTVALVPVEQRIARTVVENQWNSLDFSLSEFTNMTKNAQTFIRIDNTDANTTGDLFLIDNIYFWREADDNVKPEMVSAALVGEAGATTATISVAATDVNTGGEATVVTQYLLAINGAEPIEKTADGSGNITLNGLNMLTNYTIAIKAKDNSGNISENEKTVAFATTFDANTNLALGKTFTASYDVWKSAEIIGVAGLNDNNFNTRWASEVGVNNGVFVQVDLEQVYDLTDIKIFWEGAYSVNYIIKGSTNGTDWEELTTRYTTAPTNVSQSTPQVYDVRGNGAQYIRLESEQCFNADWGISIWEFQVYGSGLYTCDGKPVIKSVTTENIQNSSIDIRPVATDCDGDELTYTLTVEGVDVANIAWNNGVFHVTGLEYATTYNGILTVTDDNDNTATQTVSFSTADKWTGVDWIPDVTAAQTYEETFKILFECDRTGRVQQVQGDGLYITFPAAGITTNLPASMCTVPNAAYILIDPAKLVLKETEVIVNYAGGSCNFTIYNKNGAEAITAPTLTKAELAVAGITAAQISVAAESGDGSYNVNGVVYQAVDSKILVTGLTENADNTLVIKALNNVVKSESITLTVKTTKNIAKGQASASQSLAGLTPDKAIDGDYDTWWESGHGAELTLPAIWTLDLKETVTAVTSVDVVWDGACSNDFDVQVSANGTDWTTIITDNTCINGNCIRSYFFAPQELRYVRLYCRAAYNVDAWGLKLREFRINGTRPEMNFTALTLAATGSNAVELTPACVGADHYIIKIGEGEYAPAEVVSNGNIQVRGLAENTTYTFYVKAVNAADEKSEEKTVTTTTFANYSIGATAMSNEANGEIGGIDDNEGSTWSGNYANNQDRNTWWQVDFGGTYSISGVEILWEAAHSKSFDILTSLDGVHWNKAKAITDLNLEMPGGQGLKVAQIIPFDAAVTAQFIRFQNHENILPYPVCFWEFRAFGEAGQTKGAASTTKVVYHDCAATHSAIATLDTDVPFVYARQVHELQWHTLYLPFEVTDVTFINPNDNKEYRIKPRRQAETEGEHIEGNYWLYHFDKADTDLAGFKEIWVENASTETLPAKNIPYIMQFPNVSNNHAFEGATVLFYGKNYEAGAGATAVEDDHFAYTGNPTVAPLALTNADYVLDAAQGFFVEAPEGATLPAFECYLHSTAATVARMPRISWDGQSAEIVTDLVDSQLSTLNCQISANGITLMSDQPTAYAVYTITGQVVTSGNMQQGSLEINLSQGLYLIRLGNETFKVLR